MAVPADLAAALKYGPTTQGAIRRSQYLSDALKALSADGGKITGGFGELGAKLLAQAILQRGSRKAEGEAVTALRGEQDAESTRLLTGLGYKPPAAPAPAPAPPPIQLPPAAPPVAAAAPAPPQAPPPLAQQPQDPKARLLAQLAWHEARGEPAIGQQGVAAVALNRARQSGKPLDQVIFAPHQFSGFTPERAASIPDAELSQIMANIAPALAGQDPTGGADHFYNPSIANPSWGHGDGQMIGQHKFMRLGYGGHPQQGVDPEMAAGANPYAPPPPPSPPDPNGPPVQNAGPQPSAPVSSPPAAGSPAAGMLPQATPAAGSAQWPTWKPSPDEIGYVEGLLRDPRTHDAGVAEAMKMRQKMTQPVEAQVIDYNGVKFYVPKTPGDGPTVMIPVPREAMTQQRTAEQMGIVAAPGTSYGVDPLGNAKPLSAPPSGQMATSAPGQPYTEHYVPGGQNDPTVPQRPQQGYAFTGPGAQAPIQGGPADPRTPTNLIEGTKGLRSEIAPIVQQAVGLQRNINAVRAGVAQRNGSGDVAAVTGLQKLIDEGVVQAGEMNNQLNAQGLHGGIAGVMSYLQSSGKFDDVTRQKLHAVAESIYSANNRSLKDRVLGYRPIADKAFGPGSFDGYVLTPEVVGQLGWNDAAPAPPPPHAPPVFQPGTRDAALAEALKRPAMRQHLTPQQMQRAKELGLIP